MTAQKIRVAQQYVNSSNGGGLKTEYSALAKRKSLDAKYEFIPVVLDRCHNGISIDDILFYRKEFKKAHPDIIHIRGAGIESFNAVVGAKLARQGKILVAVHGMFSDLVYYNPLKKWICKNIIEQMIFYMADGISCVYEKASGRDNFRKFKAKMLPPIYNRMPYFRDLSECEKAALRDELKLPQDAVIGIFTGRITREKGLSYLAEALKAMDKCWPEDLLILIVGDGEYLAEMQSKCSEMNHFRQVIFTGQQGWNDVRKHLCAADFFLFPSLHENMPISILEACAAKLPCIVTDVGGNTEIIKENINGIIIPAGSAEAIFYGIKKMCDYDFRVYLREHEKQIDYNKFSDEQVDKQLEKVYEKLLNR